MNGVGDLAPDTKIGPYRIIRRIGSGGMGVVYEAYDDSKHRRIALKIVLPNALVNDNAVERFRAEGRALARVNHPNVVSLYELTEHEGLQVLAMEYLDGEPLDLYLLDHPCGMCEIIDILRQIAEGLKAAHEEKIIHRDLKPANILIATGVNFAGNVRRAVKVIDFGISKMQFDSNSPKTATDVILGTANYIAPEVLLGADAAPSTDIYSLGLLYWQLLTGRIPFEGRTNVDVVRRIMNENLEMPAKIDQLLSPSLRQLFKKMTARDHRARYLNLEDLIEDLDRITYEPMSEELSSSITMPLTVTNQAEIRSRLKLQGYEPIEINFIMKLTIEQYSGPKPKMTFTSATAASDFPEIYLKEPAIVKALELYKQLRSQASAQPTQRPEPAVAPVPLESPRPAYAPKSPPTEKPASARRFENAGSWLLIGLAILISSGLILKVVSKRFGNSLSLSSMQSSTQNSSQSSGPNSEPSSGRSMLGSLGAAMARLGASPLIDPPRLEAPLPSVNVNDSYVLRVRGETFEAEQINKTQVWKANSITGERANWVSDDKFLKLSFTNPFLTSIRILNSSESSGKIGEAASARDDVDQEQGGDIEGDPAAIFPLEIGKSHRFTRVVHEGLREVSRMDVTCLVVGRDLIAIELGTFDTFKVQCEQLGSKGLERSIFWYSPLAQRWLKAESETLREGGGRAWRKSEVMAFRLSNGNTLRAPSVPSF